MNKYNRLLIIIIILLVGINGFFIYEYVKDRKSNNTIVNNYEINGVSTDLTKVIDDNRSSIVTITNNTSSGTGFIYKKEDNRFYVLTALHVLNDNNFVVLASGSKLNSTIKGYDAMLDLAVLEVESNLEVKPVNLGNSSIVKQGEFIVSIGTPSNIEYAGSAELGIISKSNITLQNSIKFNNQNLDYYGNYIQISSNLTNGYSGAPIINMNSEVIGMCLMEDEKNVFVSPINEIRIVADKIINGEEYSKLNLGVKGDFIFNMENYEKASLNIPLDITSGLYVKEILPDSLSSTMGIKVNDIIKSINGKQMDNLDSYLEVEYTNSKDIKIIVIRNDEEIELTSTIYD